MSSAEGLWQLHVEFQPAIYLANRTFGVFLMCVVIHIPNIVAEEMQHFELVISLFLQREDTYHECHLEDFG